MSGLNAPAAGGPVGSVQRKLSVVIRPLADAPKESEGGTLRLVRLGEFQRIQIAARQPLDPRGDNVIPIGLARELGDLFVAKVVQARKPNGSHAVRRPAPCSRWDEKVEQVEAPVAPMLLVDLPDDLLVQILASLTGSARAHRHKETPHECDLHHIKLLHGHMAAAEAHEITFTEGRAIAEVCACCHVFATCARAAAKVVADRHGWRLLPVAGSTPMQHLSRLEQDTTLVRAILRQVNRDARPLPTVSLWIDEVSRRRRALRRRSSPFAAHAGAWQIAHRALHAGRS